MAGIESSASVPCHGQILVVDDHAKARESMADILRHVGHDVAVCSSAREALLRLERESFDVILTDLMMPGMTGIEFIKELERRRCESQVVMVTAHASVETAVAAMRHGAFDYIEKPFTIDQLESLVARALSHGGLLGKRSTMPDADGDGVVMVGESPAMRQLRNQIRQAAATDVTVLICGESGTGKELVARSLHQESQRSQGPLVSLNCPALSPQLMESELFGHERGAFTSADAPRIGRFELADGGSILLDEITEIELPLQAKLLRVLQEMSFERVGSSETIHIDTRVLATTNRNLKHEVDAGRFRQDLFYRLAVVPIQVPPLRERREDVMLLVRHFLETAAQRLQREPVKLAPGVETLLNDYHWPGNVRELENLMTRATVLHAGRQVSVDELAPWLIDGPVSSHRSPVHASESLQSSPSPLGEGDAPAVSSVETETLRLDSCLEAGTSLQEMERALIEATLERFEGHREKTAKALGIGVRTLTNKLRRFGYAPREKSYVTRTTAKSA